MGCRQIVPSVIAVILWITMTGTQIRAATYYMSPTGSDANTGEVLGSPWLTFAFSVSKLMPGDTLVLANGLYDSSNSGPLNIHCGTNTVSGTAAKPITLRAANSRRALIKGSGQSTVVVRSCGWWNIEGLHLENQDNSDAVGGNVVQVNGNSHDIVIRNCILAHPNRTGNYGVAGVGDYAEHNLRILFEDNEVYFFHRNGISCTTGSTCIVRRNYVNPLNARETCPTSYCDGVNGDGIICMGPWTVLWRITLSKVVVMGVIRHLQVWAVGISS
ncbi:MAG: hypothetical protein R3C68_02330 [Myxococcota bacterium]